MTDEGAEKLANAIIELATAIRDASVAIGGNTEGIHFSAARAAATESGIRIYQLREIWEQFKKEAEAEQHSRRECAVCGCKFDPGLCPMCGSGKLTEAEIALTDSMDEDIPF